MLSMGQMRFQLPPRALNLSLQQARSAEPTLITYGTRAENLHVYPGFLAPRSAREGQPLMVAG